MIIENLLIKDENFETKINILISGVLGIISVYFIFNLVVNIEELMLMDYMFFILIGGGIISILHVIVIKRFNIISRIKKFSILIAFILFGIIIYFISIVTIKVVADDVFNIFYSIFFKIQNFDSPLTIALLLFFSIFILSIIPITYKYFRNN